MIDLSPLQPWLGTILTDTIALYWECCEQGCVAASNQSVYDYEGCVAGYVHAWKKYIHVHKQLCIIITSQQRGEAKFESVNN